MCSAFKVVKGKTPSSSRPIQSVSNRHVSHCRVGDSIEPIWTSAPAAMRLGSSAVPTMTHSCPMQMPSGSSDQDSTSACKASKASMSQVEVARTMWRASMEVLWPNSGSAGPVEANGRRAASGGACATSIDYTSMVSMRGTIR